ncbi:MAG: sodium:solute symporter [Opitutaceae bacterium]|nr:sodium:solute symporter [Opitutaceae bacterium]
MQTFSGLDWSIIIAFLALILFIGLVAARIAARSLEHYFLAGRKMPWYMLGVTSGWFDMTGTMIITSFLFLLGPQGLYIEFRGGAGLTLAFMLAYTGKWLRRSGCMTIAEWNTYRFGTGFSAEFLRLASAILSICLTILMLAYLVRGTTLFMGMVFPLNPLLVTTGIIGFASFFTMVSGFYGVVLTDLVEGAIMIVGSVVISVVAWNRVPDSSHLALLAQQVTGNLNWLSSLPAWHATVPKGYEAYHDLVMAMLFYLVRNVLGGMGVSTGAEARFFGARSPREASLQCLLQAATMMFRWPLMISCAVLGLFLVDRFIPDRAVTAKASAVIYAAEPHLTAGSWHAYTSRIAHHPETAPPEVVAQLKDIMGPEWQRTLLLVGANGTVNPEVILPAVMLFELRPGLRGFLVVCMIAALMGALTHTVNNASAFFVRDIYQNFLRPKATNRELIFQAYLSSALIVLSGVLLGAVTPSINSIWSWYVMGFGAGTLGPSLLRFYWWRTNAWGMAAGIFSGGAAAVLQRWLIFGMPEWLQFILMTSISVLMTIVVSHATKPTPAPVVQHFYETTRPFGKWGPLWKKLSDTTKARWRTEHRFDLLSVVCALVWQVLLCLMPMQFLTHNFPGLYFTIPLFLFASSGLYYFWWRNLPPASETIENFSSPAPMSNASTTVH